LERVSILDEKFTSLLNRKKMELGPEFTELFREEKALRQAEEVNAPGSGKVLCEIIGKLYEQGSWDSLKEGVRVLGC
jgi:hypothetical protein